MSTMYLFIFDFKYFSCDPVPLHDFFFDDDEECKDIVKKISNLN